MLINLRRPFAYDRIVPEFGSSCSASTDRNIRPSYRFVLFTGKCTRDRIFVGADSFIKLEVI